MKKKNVVVVTKEDKLVSGSSRMPNSMAVNLQKTGMKRRKKEVRHMKVLAGLSVIFLALTLLFSENMKSYQQEINFHNYGEWFLRQPEGMIEISHPYLKRAGKISTGSEIYRVDDGKEGEKEVEVDPTDDSLNTGAFLGTMDAKAIDMGNISLYEGRMPEAEKEIVMELSVLQALGYDYEIGQEISFYVNEDEGSLMEQYQKDERAVLHRMTFRLVGTLKSYTARWAGGEKLAGAIISEAAFEKLTMSKKEYTFFQIKEEYEEVDANKLQKSILENVDTELEEMDSLEAGYCYNSFAYENSFWDNQIMYRNMMILLMVMGAASLAYLMTAYLSRRRVYYYRLRSIGATAMQIRRMALYECAGGTIVPACLALAVSYLGSILIVWGVAQCAEISFFYVFHIRTLGIIVGCVILVLLVSMIVAVSLLGAKRIDEKRRGISSGRLRRMRKRAKKRKRLIGSRELLCRERMKHPFSVLFVRLMGVLVCTVILCCMAQIYDKVKEYDAATQYASDYSVSVPVSQYEYTLDDIKTDADSEGGIKTGGGCEISEMEKILPDSMLKTLVEMSGVQSIDYITCDNTHIFDWEDKHQSVYWKEFLKENVTGNLLEGEKGESKLENKLYPDMYSGTYFKDFEPIWKRLKRHLNTDIADYDKICQGEQAILLLMGVDQGDDDLLGKENTLKEGDILQICTSGKLVSVEIAGILSANEFFNLLDESTLYNLLGSETLGRRIAKEDGIEYGYNRLKIDLNALASEEASGKMITQLCTLNHMEYSSSMEMLQYIFQQIVQSVLVYGTLAVVILIMYLFISFCILKEEGRRQLKQKKQLHYMGMSLQKLYRLEWRDGFREGLFLLISTLLFCIVQAKGFWVEYYEVEGGISGMYSGFFGKEVYFSSVRGYILYSMLDAISIWWFFLFMIGIMIFLHRRKGERHG